MSQHNQSGNASGAREAAPPAGSTTIPTRNASTRGAAELPADTPGSSRPSQGQRAQVAAPESPQRKPEGSQYASSYRPSDQQATTPAVHSVDPLHENAASYHVGSEENPDHPPPAYTELPGQINDENNDLGANAVVAEDGRVNIRINQKSRRLSQLFTPQLQQQVTQADDEAPLPPCYVPTFLGGAPGQEPPPPMNVVIHVVGSRGDVQPFVALGKVLKETYHHRVRLATHPVFKDFVRENGLEFFSIGGDPAELMAFMVKNPGLMPGFDTLRSGDVGQRRRGIAEIVRGTWRSCIESGDGLGVDPLKQSVEEWMGVEEELPDDLKRPFVADAIIANPPSFGHIHCAEKLGIPLHMMFTMPWSPTQSFSHPLANIQSSNADQTVTNFISYALVDMLTWQGLGDIINRFRKDSLGLDPISMIWAPGMLARMKIPYTYCWSPALIPKPKDWGQHISIAGFYFLNLASNYTPEPALAEYLAAGEPPVYIGFGSIVVDDPNAMTNMIFEAVKKTGRRALVSKGWGGLGADELGVPEGVFMLGNVPHDWLFKHVAAVVHHGGAGTTAAGIAAGRPTVVIPFFGDQPFWGAMTAKAGAGPHPIPYKELTADKLADAIMQALKPESLERAQELANKISQERGDQKGASSFHQNLKYDDLRCSVARGRPAVWRLKRTQVKLSAMAATVLAQEGHLNFNELKLFRPREYEPDQGPWDPITGGATAIMGTATTMLMGVADLPIETLKILNIHPDAKKGKQKNQDKGKGKAEGSAPDADSERTGRDTEAKSTVNTDHSAYSDSTTNDADTGASPTPSKRNAFMAQALAAAAQKPRSCSRSQDRSTSISSRLHGQSRTQSRTQSATTGEFNPESARPSFNTEAAVNTGKGLFRFVGAGLKAPLDFSLNLAKGSHNVPKLMGGEVRKVDKVTDFRSGVTVAGKEFGLGLYEGLTGMVTEPMKGAKKDGAAGAIKGAGRGIFGLPFKFMAGFWAIPGYTMKGIYQEAMKSKGAGVQNYIIAARISQGYDEASAISRHEKDDIIARWQCIKLNVKRKKNPGEDQLNRLHELVQDRRNKRSAQSPRVNSPFNRPEKGRQSSQSQPSIQEDNMHHAATLPRANLHAVQSSHSVASEKQRLAQEEEAERLDLERAIANSTAQSSQGDQQENEMMARAIQASITELERPISYDEDEGAALERAVTASMEEATRSGATEEDKKLLEQTLKMSLTDQGGKRQHTSDSEWDSSDTEDDEEFRRVLAESKELAHLHSTHMSEHGGAGMTDEDHEAALRHALEESKKAPLSHDHDAEEQLQKALEESKLAAQQQSQQAHAQGDDEEAFNRALQESQQAEAERQAILEQERTEEEVVLEYVKKQSLAEEEHRRRLRGGRDFGESSWSGANAGGSGSGGA